MKIIMMLMAIVALSFSANADAEGSNEKSFSPEAVEAANLMNLPTVRSCISSLEKQEAASFVISSMTRTASKDEEELQIEGVLINGLPKGSAKIILRGEFVPMIGQTVYQCNFSVAGH